MRKLKKIETEVRKAEQRQKKAEDALKVAKYSVIDAKVKMLVEKLMYEQIHRALLLYSHFKTEETQNLIYFTNILEERIIPKAGDTEWDNQQKLARLLSYAYCQKSLHPFMAVDALEEEKLKISYAQIEQIIIDLNINLCPVENVDWGEMYLFFSIYNADTLWRYYIILHTEYGLHNEKAQTQRVKKLFRPTIDKSSASYQELKKLWTVSSNQSVNPQFLSLLEAHREGDAINHQAVIEAMAESMSLEDLRHRHEHFTTHLNMLILFGVHWKLTFYEGETKPAFDPTVESLIAEFEEKYAHSVSKQTIIKLYPKFLEYYVKNYEQGAKL